MYNFEHRLPKQSYPDVRACLNEHGNRMHAAHLAEDVNYPKARRQLSELAPYSKIDGLVFQDAPFKARRPDMRGRRNVSNDRSEISFSPFSSRTNSNSLRIIDRITRLPSTLHTANNALLSSTCVHLLTVTMDTIVTLLVVLFLRLISPSTITRTIS
jgi:hypothetical protein